MSNIDSKAFFKISYGLYLATTFNGVKHNGMILNTAIQVTSSPERLSVTINKDTFTHSVILETKKLNICCLTTKTPFSIFENFGFKSGKDVDKFTSIPFDVVDNGLAVLKDYSVKVYLTYGEIHGSRTEIQIKNGTLSHFCSQSEHI